MEKEVDNEWRIWLYGVLQGFKELEVSYHNMDM